MSVLKHIVIKGIPISYNSSSKSKTLWKGIVASEAKKVFANPLTDQNLKITITHFYDKKTDIDTDNISKPIVDALGSIAYEDDDQISDRDARRRDIGSSYTIKGLPPEVAVSLALGDEFVWIQISNSNNDL